MKYRPEIDGLRAVAVLAVLFYHLDELDSSTLPIIRGGLLGVDIFFVISGYLITNILLKSLENKSFSIAAFYERRARRILPALIVMLVFTSIVAYNILNTADYRLFNKGLLSVSTFISNFFFLWDTQGYFAVNAKQMALRHTWSVSVEEQFYVLYPVLLYLINRFFARRFTKAFLLILLVASLAGCCIVGLQDGNKVFFNSLYRFWELLAGGLLAAGILPVVKNRVATNFLSLTGVALIASGFYFFGKIPYNFVFSIVSVAGAFLLLYAMEGSKTFVGSVLSCRPVVFVGKCSYSLYLWHWPVMAFAALFILGGFSFVENSMIVAVSFVLALLSYRFVEQPFRKHNGVIRSRKKLLIASVSVLVLTFASAFALYKHADLSNRSPIDRMLADAANDKFWIEMVQNTNAYEKDSSAHPVSVGNKNTKVSFILWGDSHTAALMAGVDSLNRKENGKHGEVLYFTGTPPLLGVDYIFHRKLNNEIINHRQFSYIKQQTSVPTVVLDARWMTYFIRQRNMPVIKDSAINAFNGLDPSITPGLPVKQLFCASMRYTINELRKLKKKIIILMPVPETKYAFNQLTTHVRFFGVHINDLGASVADYEKHTRGLRSFFHSLEADDVQVIDTEQFFRNSKGDKYLIERNGKLLYRDGNHISRFASVEVAKELQKLIEK